MDKSKGDIFLCRSIRDHKLWTDKPFAIGQAWIDLIMRVEFKDTKALTRAGFVELKRGQLLISARKLAVDWGWSKNKVLHFLSVLESDHMIGHQKSHLNSIITILNYDQGQTFGTVKRTLKGHSRDTEGTLKGHSSIKKNEVNEVNSLTNTPPPPSEPADPTNGFTPGFLDFWSRYPHEKRCKKHDCQQAWLKQDLESKSPQILAGLDKHLKSQKWKDGYITAPLTFIHQYRWEDDPEEASKESLFGDPDER